MAVLLDSGFLLASLNSSEAEHQATIGVLESIRDPIILPIPAITEVAYLLARDIGNDTAADFISSLADTELILEASGGRLPKVGRDSSTIRGCAFGFC